MFRNSASVGNSGASIFVTWSLSKWTTTERNWVGVPGRLVERPSSAAEERRANTAKRIGFDAYGATRDTPDPVAHAVNCMLDHIHLLDKRLEAMALALERHGITGHFNHLPDLDACEIHSTVDDGESPPEKVPPS